MFNPRTNHVGDGVGFADGSHPRLFVHPIQVLQVLFESITGLVYHMLRLKSNSPEVSFSEINQLLGMIFDQI